VKGLWFSISCFIWNAYKSPNKNVKYTIGHMSLEPRRWHCKDVKPQPAFALHSLTRQSPDPELSSGALCTGQGCLGHPCSARVLTWFTCCKCPVLFTAQILSPRQVLQSKPRDQAPQASIPPQPRYCPSFKPHYQNLLCHSSPNTTPLWSNRSIFLELSNLGKAKVTFCCMSPPLLNCHFFWWYWGLLVS
jgi:hypothetical protein